MPKGNPNPSPETRFQPGNVANPGGKTKELKRLEVEAAEMSARLRHAALSAMMEKLNGNLLDVEDIVKADMLRLFKDSEDRAHGTPKAAIDHTSSDRSMTPRAIDASKLSDAALAELHRAMDEDVAFDTGGSPSD